MTEGIDRDKLAQAVMANSDLSLEQIETLFGVVSVENKHVVWRFLSMQKFQQQAIWNCRCYLKDLAPDIRVEAVR